MGLPVLLPTPVRRYMRFCRRSWLEQPESDGETVVLVGLFKWHPSIHCYAAITNFFVRNHRAVIRWFYFHRGRVPLYEKIYASFGAQPGLCLDTLGRNPKAEALARDIVAGLKNKWDVAGITVDGVLIGDLIYDTYLRAGPHATVNLEDPRLSEIIAHAVHIFVASRDYLARHRVVAVIPDHIVYIFCGILVRQALAAGIPVYLAYPNANFYLHRIDTDPEGFQIPPRWPYPAYKRLFAEIPPDQQESARARGRAELEHRFSQRGAGALKYGSGYGHPQEGPVFQDGGKDRILILLHDFCDAVHNYRHMLFPDFYEWIHFLLARAEQTDFDWYVKPHPNLLCTDIPGRDALILTNGDVIAELRAKYPKIHFLHPSVSNQRIMDAGVRAMFTVYGTGGHEFAYFGIPVVNSGDNPHCAYNFNLHPRTIEEYECCIREANCLHVEMRREEIEEYVYMNYIHFSEGNRDKANPLPRQFLESRDFQQSLSRPETFDYLAHPLSADEKQRLDRYLTSVTAPSTSPDSPNSPHK